MLGARGVTVAVVNALKVTVPERLYVIRKDQGKTEYEIPPVAKYMPTGRYRPPLRDMPCILVEVMDDRPATLVERAEDGPVQGGFAHAWVYNVRARVLASAGAEGLAEQLTMYYLQAVREALLSMPPLEAGAHSILVDIGTPSTQYTELHQDDTDASAYIGTGYVRWTVHTREVLAPYNPDNWDVGVVERMRLKVDHVLPPDGVLDPTFIEPPEFVDVPRQDP